MFRNFDEWLERHVWAIILTAYAGTVLFCVLLLQFQK